MATHVTWKASPRAIASFKIDAHRAYEVRLSTPTGSEVAGTARVVRVHPRKGSQRPNDYAVQPDFFLNFPTQNAKFYGAFSVDEAGIATLETIYLVAP